MSDRVKTVRQVCPLQDTCTSYELPHEKTNNVHMRKQRCRSASLLLISTFVFATRIVHFLFFLNPKFPASSHLLCLCSLVCVEPVQKSFCWFSHDTAPIINMMILWLKMSAAVVAIISRFFLSCKLTVLSTMMPCCCQHRGSYPRSNSLSVLSYDSQKRILLLSKWIYFQ